MSSAAVTLGCQKEGKKVRGQTRAVVDTPTLSSSSNSQEMNREIGRCISFGAPGPHVFLVVIQPSRFTEDQQQTVTLVQQLFGEKASRYTMILFTRGDELKRNRKSIHTFINENPNLRDFISQCHGGYHVFNNRKKDPKQVRELLQKIQLMVERNGGGHYTDETLQEAEEAIEEKKEELLKENPKLKQKKARRQAEEDNRFVQRYGQGSVTAAGAVLRTLGGSLGTAVPAVAAAAARFALGPAAEAAAEAAAGAAAEAAAGAAAGAAAKLVVGSGAALQSVLDSQVTVKDLFDVGTNAAKKVKDFWTTQE